MPISHPARAWPEVGRMDRDHRGQPARPIAEHMDMLVIVEIGEIPDSGHGTHLHVKKLREGVIKQRRHRVTPKLRNRDRKSTRLNSSSLMRISYAVFCLKKKK